MTPDQAKHNAVLMASETPVVSGAVQLSTWDGFHYDVQRMNVLLFFYKYSGGPGMVFLEDENDLKRVSSLMKICDLSE